MIYLDNAATTYPKPASVSEALRASVIRYGANPGRGSYPMSIQTNEQIFSVRKKLKTFFNASGEENVIFTSNCTASLNMSIKGLVKPFGHVVTSCLEHNSVMRVLQKLKKDRMITFDTAYPGHTDEQTVENFEMCIKPSTSLIICTAASNVFGDIMPIRKIGMIAKKKGIPFVVDAAQAAGVIDIDIERDNISCLCLPGHKGLYGIMGTGVMILSQDVSLDTLVEGGTGSESKNFNQPFVLPERFESGTENTPGIISLGKGIDFISRTGINKIHHHESSLIKYLYENFKQLEFVEVYNEYDCKKFVPVLSFNIKGYFSEETADMLGRDNIAVRGGFHCNPNAHKYYGTYEQGTVRVSVSYFNSKKDIDFLLNSIKKIAKTKTM